MRSRIETEARILQAARDILASAGERGLTINALARAAGAGKPLIYRYFGGLDGVRAAIVTDQELCAPEDNLSALIASGRRLAADRAARDSLRQALNGGPAPVIASAAATHNEREAEVAILYAASAFLMLWRDHHRHFAGLDLHNPNDLARAERAMAALFARGAA